MVRYKEDIWHYSILFLLKRRGYWYYFLNCFLISKIVCWRNTNFLVLAKTYYRPKNIKNCCSKIDLCKVMHGKRREGHGSIFPPTALLFTRGKELESYGGGGGDHQWPSVHSWAITTHQYHELFTPAGYLWQLSALILTNFKFAFSIGSSVNCERKVLTFQPWSLFAVTKYFFFSCLTSER